MEYSGPLGISIEKAACRIWNGCEVCLESPWYYNVREAKLRSEFYPQGVEEEEVIPPPSPLYQDDQTALGATTCARVSRLIPYDGTSVRTEQAGACAIPTVVKERSSRSAFSGVLRILVLE